MSEPSELKVLLLAGRLQVRGSCTYTLHLADRLPQHGIDPLIVTHDASQVALARLQGLPLKEYPHLHTPLWGSFVTRMLTRDFRSDPPDLIHVQSRKMVRIGTTLARRLKRPFLVTVHDYLEPGEQVRLDPQWGKAVVTVSESVRTELLARSYLPADRVVVIPGGVDPGVDGTAGPVLEPDHVPVVGTACPLESVKGLPFFLGAAQQVLATDRRVEFLIAGSGPEEANLRRLARQLGIIEHVTFASSVTDFATSLSAMDIFCLPSLRQGLGTVMFEAMAMGRPVIATGVGGVYGAVRENETALIVAPSNSTHLAQRMIELLDDPVRARSLGEAGRQMIREQFNVDQMVERTAKLYRELAAC